MDTLLRVPLLAAALWLPSTAAAQLPFVFESAAPDALDSFVSRRPSMQVRVETTGAELALANGRSIAIGFTGGSARPHAEQPLPGRSHYLLGDDPASWRRDVPHHGRVRSAGVWPGIDVVWYGRDGMLEYDLVVAPGADPTLARIRFRGADRVTVAGDGRVEIAVGDLEVVQRPPYAFQIVDGRQHAVPVRVREAGDSIVFEVSGHDRTRELIVDPQITYGSYVGGTGADAVHAMASDTAGNLYLTGLTTSANFPVVNPIQSGVAGLYDFFVTKLDPTGTTILWSTWLGGSSGGFGTDEWPVAIGVDANGDVVVLGRTETTDFPTANAFQPSLAGGVDAVVFKLNASGSQLLWSTYLGGTGHEIDRDNQIGNAGGGVQIDAGGNVFVAATTRSTDFPAVNAVQSLPLGGSDLFVARFSANGTLLYSSYLGGSGFDDLLSATPGEPGRALLCGSTSGGFPTTPGAFDTSGQRGFALSLDVSTQAIGWSTTFPSEVAEGAVDATGAVYLVGTATGSLPTTMGAHQVDHGGAFNGHGMQAFAAKLAPGATHLEFATFYGSSSANESFEDLVVDDFGHIYAVGTTSEHFGSPSNSAFVVKFNPQGSTVVYAQEVSGRNSTGRDALLLAPGTILVAGETWATTGFATPGAVQTVHGGNKDGFLARVSDDAASLRDLKFPVDRLTSSDARLGTVTLDGVAPPGGATVALTCSSPAVAVPPAVFVPAGSTTAVVPITSIRVQATSLVTITASWNGSTDQVTLRLWPGPLYRAVAIEVPGPNGSSEGLDLDAFGTVVGTNGFNAFRYHESLGVQLLPFGEAHGIADDGAIAGGNGEAVRWTPGGLHVLGALQPGMFAIGYDADLLGRVVGFSDFFNGSIYGRRAFVWSAGTGMQNLGTLGGDSSVAYAINRLGAVTGSAALATQFEHPFLWTGGGLQDLGVLPGFTNGTGLDVNDAGQVAGIMLNGSTLRAFRHTPGIGLQDLGVLPGDSSSGARGINAHGWTVGWSSQTQPNLGRAVRHVDGAMQSLHEELSAEDAFAWKLVVGHGINDAGQIAGTGTFRSHGGVDVAFRLDPLLARPYGRGCPGLDGRVTALAATGHPAAGNTVRFHVSGRPSTLALLVLGAGPMSAPLPGGCELLIAVPDLGTLLLGLDAAGTASLPVPLPATLPAQSVYLQALTLDAASANALFTSSNGLELRIL